jgi:hypothetical protein
MNEELKKEMQILFRNRRLDRPYVFNRDGKPIKGFRKAWDSACIKAGLFKVVRDDEGIRLGAYLIGTTL